MADRPALAWTLREKLRLALRPKVQGAVDRDLFAELVADAIDDVAKGPDGAPLRAALKEGLGKKRLPKLVRSWVAELPSTHRSDWLVERLASDIGFAWSTEPAAVESTISLPIAARKRIERRFRELEEDLLSRHDDDPEAEEYADVLEEELARIGAKHEALAHRLATKRFPGKSHPNTSLAFRQHLDAKQIRSPEKLLEFVTQALDLRWVEAEAPRSKR